MEFFIFFGNIRLYEALFRFVHWQGEDVFSGSRLPEQIVS